MKIKTNLNVYDLVKDDSEIRLYKTNTKQNHVLTAVWNLQKITDEFGSFKNFANHLKEILV